MKKTITSATLIGLLMTFMVMVSEKSRSSSFESAISLGILLITLWFGMVISFLIGLRVLTKPPLNPNEKVLQESIGSFLSDEGQFGGLFFLTNHRVLFCPYLFNKSRKVYISLIYKDITNVTHSQSKLELELKNKSITHIFFILDAEKLGAKLCSQLSLN